MRRLGFMPDRKAQLRIAQPAAPSASEALSGAAEYAPQGRTGWAGARRALHALLAYRAVVPRALPHCLCCRIVHVEPVTWFSINFGCAIMPV